MNNTCYKLVTLCVAGVIMAPFSGRANEAPVALDDSFTTLQGQQIQVGNDILNSTYDTDSDGFNLVKDALGTNNANYIQGYWGNTLGQVGGGLYVKTGPTHNTGWPIGETSGTWDRIFILPEKTPVSIHVRFRLKMASGYERNEFASAVFGVDSIMLGNGPSSTLVTHFGNPGNSYDSGWREDNFNIELAAGEHTLWAGVYSNNSTATNEYAEVYFDNIVVQHTGNVGVMQNDTDADGDQLHATLTKNASQGLLVLRSTGSFTYTPNPGFAGVDTFQYRVFDGKTASNVATVRITVDGIPLPAADQYTLDEDTQLTTTDETGVLQNDRDPEDSPLTATLINPPVHGQLEFFQNGSFKYLPEADYNGLDSFTYRISDGPQESEPATVALLIRPVDDPARAIADRYSTFTNQTLSVGVLEGLLSNDTDPDGPMLEAVLATPPDNGQIVLNANGSFLYTPANGYSGTVNFTYRLSSSPADAPGITVTIIVDKPKSRIVINEIMYNALGSRPPEEYIEVHNAGSSEADLSGWKFSKGVSFKFPEETRLGSGKFLVVAADRLTFRTRYPTFQGQLFGNWTGQLANSGETLQLEDAEGKNRDEVTYDDEGDWSRRRTSQPHRGFTGWVWESLHDGQGRSLELINAAASNKTGQNWIASKFNGGTPGYANSQAEADVPPFIRDVRHWPILPTSNDTVSIHAKVDDDSGAPPTKVLLHWRVDGSSFFSQAEMLDDGKADDGNAGNQVYGTSLAAQPNGTIVEFYIESSDGHGIRTWPAPTDDTGNQGANCLYQVYDAQDTGKNAPVYRLVMTSAERARHLAADHRSDSMANATFISSFDGEVKARYLASVRYRGSGSRSNNPPPYRINLAGDKSWEGVTQLNINPVNWHNQLAGSAIFNQLGLPASRAITIDFHINGQHLQADGHYVYLQPLGSEFIAETFTADPGGNLYKGRRKNESPQGGRGSGLVYYPNNPAAYYSYIKLSNSSSTDWSDVIALTKALSELTDDIDFYDLETPPAIHNNLNVDQWLRFFALNALLANTEGGLVEGDREGDDYAMYSGIKDPRFIMMPHDLDTIFSRSTWNLFRATNVPALARLINHPQIRPRYLAHVKDWCENFFEVGQFRPFLENQLLPHVPQNNINSMVNFMQTRNSYVLGKNDWFPTGYIPPPLKTIVNGEPPATTSRRRATLQVSGKNVTHYRYRINGDGQYSTSIYPVEEAIGLDNLPDGEYTVYVRGMNQAASGAWQYDIHDTQSKAWTVKQNPFHIRLNEVLANNAGAHEHEGTHPDYVEIFNSGSSAMLLEGLVLTDNLKQKDKYVFPNGIILGPGEYMILYADSDTLTSGIHLGFSLDAEGETLYLLDGTKEDASILGQVTFGLQIPDMSLSRDEELHWVLGTPTPGTTNQRVPLQSPWNLKINEWLAEGARIFNDDFVEIYNPSPLPVDISDFHLTDNPAGNFALHRITQHSYIPAHGHIAFLATGKTSGDARDLGFKLSAQREMISLLTPELQVIDTITYGPQKTDVSQGRATDGAATFAYFTLPTPGKSNNASDPNETALIAQLRITEIMYNPTGGSKYEYIELKNIGNTNLDLSDVKFTNGISYQFAQEVLQAGGTIILANDPAAFEERYEKAPDGEFSGNLSNGGEKLRLETPTGIGILEFTYRDDWYEDSDGEGFSLEISDENAYPENWDQPETWRAGRVLNGSPGGSEPPNTAPTDILLAPGTLDRDLPIGGTVGILTTIDTYPRDTFTYSLTGIGKDRFRIEGDQLLLIKTIAQAETGDISLDIRVTDSYGATFESTLLIAITDSDQDDDFDDLPDHWETSQFGNLDQTGEGDFDGDGQTNHTEFIAGTNPGDASKTFSLQDPIFENGQFSFKFDALPGKNYRIESTSNATESWETETSTQIQEGSRNYTMPVNGRVLRLYRVVLEP